MRSGCARSATISVDRALLRRRQRIGQRRDRRVRAAGPRRRCRGRRACACARATARARAGRRAIRHRQAATTPRSAGSSVVGLLRTMQRAQRLGKGRIALAREPGRVLPFRQLRQALERRIDRLAHLVRAQPFGQRIDRLDQRQLGKACRIDHAVGMHHLQHAVVERRSARDVAQLADRQELFQIVLARVEIGEGQRAGVVAGVDVVGRARPVRRRRPVAVDRDRDGDDGVRHAPRAASAGRAGRRRRSADGTGDR